MRARPKYTISIENESRLENVFRFTASPLKLLLMAAGAVCVLLLLGAFLLYISPAHTLLPGYLKDSERAETEEQHMRLDSLQMAYSANDAFLSNFLNVLDSDREVTKQTTTSVIINDSLSNIADSIIPTSPEELNFVAMMRERDKFSISVIAPLAAESLMFSAVNDESVFSEDTKTSTKGKVILSRHTPVSAIADGTVIAVSRALRDGGASIIIQHPKGFLSRCSRLGLVLVEPGEHVTGGQVIAMTGSGNARKNEFINVEMWHNGSPLIPYEYIGESDTSSPRYPIIDTEVGRGRL